MNLDAPSVSMKQDQAIALGRRTSETTGLDEDAFRSRLTRFAREAGAHVIETPQETTQPTS